MRTKQLISLILLFMSVIGLHAQTQQGIVKTKGRLGTDGSVIPGDSLVNVEVKVKGRTVVLSRAKGEFSFPIPGQRFYLEYVKAKEYVLIDPDMLSKQYAYSKENPLYIVMEKPGTQAEDKLAVERKIRRNLEKTLQQHENEIEQLKEENKISQQEYQQKLQELYASQEKNEKLISEMAERYSKMDYDQVDEFNRCISELILNGELAKADSLINSKGDIHARKAALKHHQDANAKEEKELAERQENLSKSKAYTRKELEDLAQDCYHKYEIFKVNFQNDSAAYYLEFRADLDTINVDWQNEAGLFVQTYFACYDKALAYYQRALRNAKHQYGEDHPYVATAYNNIGLIFHSQGNYLKALEYYRKALDIQLRVFGENHPSVARSYNNIGSVYQNQGDGTKNLEFLQKALEYFQKALDIQLRVLGESHSDVANSYNNMGGIFHSQGNYPKALEYFQKALNIRQPVLGENHPNVANSYNNIGMVFHSQGNYLDALEYYRKSLDIRLRVLGENHPNVAQSYNNIGVAYHNLGDYSNALEYYNNALEIRLSILGENHPDVATGYNNIGMVFYSQGNYLDALEFYRKSLDIRLRVLSENHPEVAQSYNNIGVAYHYLGDYPNALASYNKALGIWTYLDESHPNILKLKKYIKLIHENNG